MKKAYLLVPLALGIAFDVLFWEKRPGISFAMFTALCLAAGFVFLRAQKVHPARLSLLLMLPIAFFAVMSFTRLEPFTSLLNFALSLLCLALFAVTYRGGQWLAFSFSDYALNLLRLLGSTLSLGWTEIAAPQAPSGKRARSALWPLLRGLVIALPLILIFGSLLASADLIFAQKLNSLLAGLNLQNLGETILRACLVLLVAYCLLGVFLHAARRSQPALHKTQALAPFLGSIEASVVLGSILLLFGAFVLIQFQYFFSGQAAISLDGFTYSEYARRGFGELLAVAAFSLVLLQGLSLVTRRETAQHKKLFSGLGIALVALVLIILVSAFQRLWLYEAAYGFSRLRAYAHVFIIWLGVFLVVVALMEVFNHQRAFTTAAGLILLGFAATLNLLNVDAFIARQNIQRAAQGSPLDANYLSELTPDAVPVMVSQLTDPALSPALKEQIGAALACYQQRQPFGAAQPLPWQSFHLSRWNAQQALGSVADILGRYRVEQGDGAYLITSPAGVELICEK